MRSDEDAEDSIGVSDEEEEPSEAWPSCSTAMRSFPLPMARGRSAAGSVLVTSKGGGFAAADLVRADCFNPTFSVALGLT